MTVQISKISDDFSVAPQISSADIDFIAQSGFKSVINNRPDGEAGDAQPTSSEIQQAVEAAGLKYAYIPVINGQLTQAQVDETAKLLESFPKPILAFCRSGARSTNVYMLALQSS